MNSKSTYKQLLSSIQSVCQQTEEQPFTPELVQTLQDTVQPVSAFFNISVEEGIIFSFLLHSAIKDLVVTRDGLITHFGKDISALADLQELVKSLSDKKLAILKGGHSNRTKYNFKLVVAHPKALMAMSEGDITLMENRPSENFSGFLVDVNDLILQRLDESLTTVGLIEEVNKLMSMNNHLQEVTWIKAQKEIKDTDLMIFLNVCIEQHAGEEEVDIDKVTKEVFDHVSGRMEFKQSIKTEKCMLINRNYLNLCSEFFGFSSALQLSDHSINMLFSHMKELSSKPFNPRMGQFLSYDSIAEERLCYNSKENEQIQTLSNALMEERYAEIAGKMKENHMKAGFTVLMYGFPGTGKTSSVKNLARMSGRHIYLVDIPKINSKWVGESEKNLSKVFDEYRKSRKHFGKDPILLFNEADAILGNRMQVNSSVDKMRNTMQNILLQELEDFEGIFIATTNLANHLDEAFDRRFLYKLEFLQPDENVRLEILSHAFPDFDAEMLSTLNREHPLTGGQIANIKKKLLVKKMLDPVYDLETSLLSLFEEETSLRKRNKPTIGFRAHQS
jgi:hypothetical protein